VDESRKQKARELLKEYSQLEEQSREFHRRFVTEVDTGVTVNVGKEVLTKDEMLKWIELNKKMHEVSKKVAEVTGRV
jgi:hypothetical protein